MTSPAKFLFDTDFDDSPAKKEESEQPEPQFSLEELEQARQEGFSAGAEEANTASKAALETVISGSLDQIGQSIQEIFAIVNRQSAEQLGQTAQISFIIAKKLAPSLMAKFPFSEIEALVGDCLADLRHEPRIVVRASETLTDDLGSRLENVANQAGFSGKIVVLPDPQLNPNDCRVEWADGGAERDLATLTATIDVTIEKFIEAHAPNAAGDAPIEELSDV